MKELVIKKCAQCGALVKVIEDCHCQGCGIKCCGEEMKELVPNSVEAAVEKHLPTYEIKDDKIAVKVNHVMEEEHFIEWITVIYPNGKEITRYFEPGKEAEDYFEYIPGSLIYSYCNKHGLWKKEVE
jgi:superoxide reductase